MDKVLESDGPGSLIILSNEVCWLFMSVEPFLGERKVRWFRFTFLVGGSEIKIYPVKRNSIRVRYRQGKQPKPWLKELIDA